MDELITHLKSLNWMTALLGGGLGLFVGGLLCLIFRPRRKAIAVSAGHVAAEAEPAPERVAARPPGWQGPLPPAAFEAQPEQAVAVVPQSLRAVAPEPLIRDGKFIHVELESPQVVAPGDRMKFVATLFNATDARWNLVAEIVVRKGDGSQETLLQGYPLRLASGRRMRVPLGLKAREQRFPPGITEFVAFLRDRQGELVDRASIAFVVTVPLH